MKTKLIFLGPPGAGKGTYASRVAPKLGVPQISTGDLFRENMAKDTELGRKAKEYVNAGKLVPDEIVVDMVRDRLSEDDATNGYILDGFPRTLTQAEALDSIAEIEAVINLVVPDSVIIERLSSRIQCKSCAAVFNLKTMPPQEEGKCDKCGGELYQREDDTPAVIQKRLDAYKAQTAPLIEYYKARGVIANIHNDKADAPVDGIVARIMAALE
ncbi:MAG: adenylate kinase [Candidatus Diapherotrites archaeon]|nr:adenylate kinase [Candidatus Diapherotrites archaeon]